MTESARLPEPIERALLLIPSLPIKSGPAMAMHWLVRCASATDASRRFRVGVEHLRGKLRKSKATTDRYLASLRDDGWIVREQNKRGARRHGWKQAWTQLTDKALQALGLQRDSLSQHSPKPCSKGEAAGRELSRNPCQFVRVRRIPADLADLAQRVGASRVVWLMAECRRAGRRLQEFAAAALAADSPAGFVLRAIRSRHPAGKCVSRPGEACGGGDSRTDARQYLAAKEKAGTRTEAGRLAGLEMLRALRR